MTSTRFRQRRFEDLELCNLMTAAGWESPLFASAHAIADNSTPELHGLLDPGPGPIPNLEHHGAQDLATAVEPRGPDGFINLRDYNGNLLTNWQELVSVHDDDHDENPIGPYDHPLTHEVLVGDELDGGEQSLQAQYSLWNNKWSQPGGLGSSVTISYSYSNILNGTLVGISADQIKSAMQKVMQLWSTHAPLNFVEVVDSGPAPGDSGYAAGTTPNIRIGYHAIDGASQVLAHAYYPQGTQGLSGDMHFDSGETWRIGAGAGGIDFVEVALHEMGHSLGLQHETTNTAIMNPYYGGRFANLNAAYLLSDDINGIRALYGSGTGSVTPIVVNHTPVLMPSATCRCLARRIPSRSSYPRPTPTATTSPSRQPPASSRPSLRWPTNSINNMVSR